MKKDIKKKNVEKKSGRHEPERIMENDKARSKFFRSVIAFLDNGSLSESPDQIVRSVLVTLSKQLDTGHVAFYRGVPAEGLFRYKDSLDHGKASHPPAFEIDSAFARWVGKERKPVFIDGFYSGAGNLNPREMEFLSRIDENGFSYACVVEDNHHLYGMIFFGGGSEGKSYSGPEFEFVEMLSKAAAVKIRDASLVNDAAEFKKRIELFDHFRQEVFKRNRDRLKTPLSVMKSTLYSVESDDVSTGILVDMARSAVLNMESRLKQFLSVCDIDSEGARLDIRKTDISSLAEEILKEYIPELEEKSITVRFDDKVAGRELYVDPVSLGVVIRNIMDNAINYIDRGGEIEVDMLVTGSGPQDDDGVELRMWNTPCLEQGKNEYGGAASSGNTIESISREISLNRNSYENNLVIKIRDNGPGIAGDRIAVLSYIPKRTDSDEPGSSASIPTGLAVAQNIIEGHGGRFFCKSTVGTGSEFSVWLPAGF